MTIPTFYGHNFAQSQYDEMLSLQTTRYSTSTLNRGAPSEFALISPSLELKPSSAQLQSILHMLVLADVLQLSLALIGEEPINEFGQTITYKCTYTTLFDLCFSTSSVHQTVIAVT